jgi:hypothetical protein
MTKAAEARLMDHETIWLGPKCEEQGDGRTWAPNNPWGDKCDHCDETPVKYVRADLYDAALARAEAAEAELENLRERCAVYKSQIEAGAKRIEAAEKALEPFARIAPAVEVTDKRDGNCVHRQFFDGRYYELTKDDFRRAARALSAGGGQ